MSLLYQIKGVHSARGCGFLQQSCNSKGISKPSLADGTTISVALVLLVRHVRTAGGGVITTRMGFISRTVIHLMLHNPRTPRCCTLALCGSPAFLLKPTVSHEERLKHLV